MDGTEGVTDIEGALIFGPRGGAGDSLIEIVGISGVTEIEGGLTSRPLFDAVYPLTDMLGIGGVTPMEGVFTLGPRPVGPLMEMDGVSETEIVGMEGADAGLEYAGLERAEGGW